jgi:hypothetical protein
MRCGNWEWREQLMEDGKLINAAPFDSYSLKCLKRAMMKRQINDSLCVIPIKILRVRKDGKAKANPLPFQ